MRILSLIAPWAWSAEPEGDMKQEGALEEEVIQFASACPILTRIWHRALHCTGNTGVNQTTTFSHRRKMVSHSSSNDRNVLMLHSPGQLPNSSMRTATSTNCLRTTRMRSQPRCRLPKVGISQTCCKRCLIIAQVHVKAPMISTARPSLFPTCHHSSGAWRRISTREKGSLSSAD